MPTMPSPSRSPKTGSSQVTSVAVKSSIAASTIERLPTSCAMNRTTTCAVGSTKSPTLNE